ncbi:MAG TPA: isoleucine--tRNA ligase [Candidatus Acidoferrales bacterium]|nr:isoleucine--tRNA ligase [Candidatus Acidoferrales bacterium]
MLKSVSPKVDFAKVEEEITKYWKKNKTFEKSVEKDAPNGDWTFLDGPPFVTGMPHYGSLLSSLPKDVFGRYWTMKGYRVRRVWGWDGHGLPIENKVENELEIARKKDIEEVVGIKKFIDECKHYVNIISSDWEWYVDRIGRWVDFKNAYKTWDTPYMESVMWVFKQMYDKDYIYKGLKVSLYCPHCATPISNFEVAMDADNYKEIEEDGTTYKYKVINEANTYFLAWSTTPWNKIVTPALAVNPKFIYVKVQQEDEFYILAKSTVKELGNKRPYKIVQEYKGSELVGKAFEPHYDYYKDKIKDGEKAFVVVPGDFVTDDEGTGIVTIAAYGEEDLKVMQEHNIHIELHVDEEGQIKSDVPQFGGLYYLKANKVVDEDLTKRGLVYENEKRPHRVPLCWRCHTRLYYAPITAWYVNVQKLKKQMKETNELVNWFPKHFKHGRFLKSLENAPDWNISRNRYWGSPVPVWECECGERFVPGSIKELEEKSGQKIVELHKPDIDEVIVTCDKCGKKAHRVPEVLDSWIEAGSASFGERHYPFGKQPPLESFYPPDFIGEYTGQIRAWFYVLHVIANALELNPDRKNILARNVLVEGVILGSDGRKMSKNFKNYPDPREMLEKYGGDALRLYLLGSPVMHGEDILISEEQYKMQVRSTMLILWNVYNFFVSNALLDGWDNKKGSNKESNNILDQWILARLHETTRMVTVTLDGYDTVSAIDAIKVFVDDLSTWYIRRSRERVGPRVENNSDKDAFYATTYQVLTTVCKLIAPITPFIAEEIYRNLTGEESVHLANWPEKVQSIDENINLEMDMVRKIVEIALSKRKESQIKVRQPLRNLTYSLKNKLSEDLEELLLKELNVKKVTYKKGELAVDLDLTITPELKAEGEARDIVRKIQDERKKIGTALDEQVAVSLESWPTEFESYIKQQALVKSLTKGTFAVKRI